ncbi:TetR/AcrR family transcriptional regulator [Evansella tamaricis]|nr:TetR/AcrR family transcriptional regulator [Evansella tamaricis]
MKTKTKDKITETAIELFNEHGTSQVSTNHIAEKMGISTGNLYYHFKNKEEIIREILEWMITDWGQLWSNFLEDEVTIPENTGTETSKINQTLETVETAQTAQNTQTINNTETAKTNKHTETAKLTETNKVAKTVKHAETAKITQTSPTTQTSQTTQTNQTNLDILQSLLRMNFQLEWKYRFFYREHLVLLKHNSQLEERHHAIQQTRLQQQKGMIDQFVNLGIIRKPDTHGDTEALLKISWIISNYWLSFLESGGEEITEASMDQGFQLLMTVIRPYLNDNYK